MQRLGKDEDVGHRLGFMLQREQPAGAAEGGDHFVEDQQRSGFVTTPAQGGQEAGSGQHHAGFGLYRFDDDGGGALVDQVEGFRLVETQEIDFGQQRLEGLAVERIAADRHRTERVSVEAAAKRGQPTASGGLAREF
jgi:hypothetical protein